jgi:hypothetical protein
MLNPKGTVRWHRWRVPDLPLRSGGSACNVADRRCPCSSSRRNSRRYAQELGRSQNAYRMNPTLTTAFCLGSFRAVMGRVGTRRCGKWHSSEADNTSLRACPPAHLTTSGIVIFSSDASANLRNVAPPSSHLRVASAFAWTSTNCRWTVSHDSSRVHQCVARLGLLLSGDSGSLGFLVEPVVFFTFYPRLR